MNAGRAVRAAAVGFGVPEGGECAEDLNCALGGDFCVRPCAGDEQCLAPALCLPGKGGDACQTRACSSDVACPEGSVCGESSTCQRPGGGGGGCSSVPAGPGGLFLLLVLAAVWRWRRS